jgi:hypothetical protein
MLIIIIIIISSSIIIIITTTTTTTTTTTIIIIIILSSHETSPSHISVVDSAWLISTAGFQSCSYSEMVLVKSSLSGQEVVHSPGPQTDK